MDEEFCLSEKLKGRDIDGFVLKDVKEAIRLLKKEIKNCRDKQIANYMMIYPNRKNNAFVSMFELELNKKVNKIFGKELSNGN